MTAADIPVVPGQGQVVNQAQGQMSEPPTLIDGIPASADVLLIDRATGAVVQNLGSVTIASGAYESSTLSFPDVAVLESQALTLGNIVAGNVNPGKTLTVVVKKA